MAPKFKLEPGSTYAVEVKIPRTPGTFLVGMKLVEKRSNGIYWMEREAWILVDPPYTGRRDHKWRKGVELVKVRQAQIKALVS